MLAGALAACGGDAEIGPERACDALSLDVSEGGPTGIVLVLNDTMRRDRLGIHGGPARTPVLDAFAAEHLVFERAYSQAPWTVPSIASLFTSLHPSQHGVVSHPEGHVMAGAGFDRPVRRSDVLAPGHTTLAEVLRAAGLRTGAFVSNPWLDRRFGFAQGFDHYDDSLGIWETPAPLVVAAALRWLGGVEPGERFFAYVHTLDSHRPYGTLAWEDVVARSEELRADRRELEPIVKRETASLIRFEGEGAARGKALRKSLALLALAYDKGIENFDLGLGVLLEGLRARPDWPRIAVVVTSDHGEALYERGYGNHGRGLYDEEVAVPLVARLPGVTPDRGRVDCAVGLVDLLPSLCAYLGVACPEKVFGTSFLGGGEPRYVLGEGVLSQATHRSIRNGRWKLVYEPEGAPDRGKKPNPYSLYDLRADPGEARDLLAEEPANEASARVATRLAAELEARAQGLAGPAPGKAPIDPALEKRLQAIGYLE